MIVDNYNLLPDGMEPSDVEKLLTELLSEIETSVDIDVLDVTEALYQLADRQWHTYTILPMDYRNRIEKWITENWLHDSLDFVVKIGFIAGSLGLPGVLHLLDLELRHPHLKDSVRKEIVSIVEEIKPKIENPYLGMDRA